MTVPSELYPENQEPVITESFEQKATFPEKRPRGSLPIDVSFGFEDGAESPYELRVGSREYQVVCSQETYSAPDFFKRHVAYDENGDINNVTFSNPAAKTYFNTICRLYESTQLSALRSVSRQELELAHVPSPGKKPNLVQQLIDRNYASNLDEDAQHDRGWRSDIRQNILAWIAELESREVPIVSRTTKIKVGGRPLTLTRVTIGEVSMDARDSYFLEEMVAQSLFFSADVLRTGLKRDVEIFDTSVFDTKDGNRYTDPMSAELGKKGKRSGNTLLVNSTARPQVQSIEQHDDEFKVLIRKVIDARFQAAVVQHECGHFIDPCFGTGTNAQAEGFAKAFESGFNFNRVINQMGRDSPEMVPEKIKLMFSNNIPDSILQREQYYLTGAFDSWLYEKLGPSDFMRFYLLVSGREDMGQGEGLSKISDTLNRLPAKLRHRGNLSASLNELSRNYRWCWENTDELINEFCDDFNKAIKRQ